MNTKNKKHIFIYIHDPTEILSPIKFIFVVNSFGVSMISIWKQHTQFVNGMNQKDFRMQCQVIERMKKIINNLRLAATELNDTDEKVIKENYLLRIEYFHKKILSKKKRFFFNLKRIHCCR